MKRVHLVAAVACSMFAQSVFAGDVWLTSHGRQPLVQEVFEVTAYRSNCFSYDGQNSCVLAIRSLDLPLGGKVIGVRPSNPDFIVTLQTSVESALSGIRFYSNEPGKLDEALKTKGIKVEFVYQGPEINRY